MDTLFSWLSFLALWTGWKDGASRHGSCSLLFALTDSFAPSSKAYLPPLPVSSLSSIPMSEVSKQDIYSLLRSNLLLALEVMDVTKLMYPVQLSCVFLRLYLLYTPPNLSQVSSTILTRSPT